MKVHPECISCFFKQVLNVSRVSELSEVKTIKVMREVARFIHKELDVDKSPGHNATFIHRIFKEMTGVDDPYKILKDKYNDIATKLAANLEPVYSSSENKLSVAVKLAALGNVIDFGVPRHFDLEKEVENFFNLPFAYFDVPILERFLVTGKTVLYVADNAGEIVFDKFLIKALKESGLRVTLAVRGAPILNDATVEDAMKTEVAQIVDRIVTTGGDFIGVDFSFVSEEFKESWESAFFVISKGQANFETLDGVEDKDIFFILKAKCPPVARELKCNLNDLIFLYNKRLLEIKEENEES